ncbi:ralA-binding protein 1-like isoform X2 [Corticium candelabrum]|uniref:ralA-binding protein 1-like isoform X2 n=1 Tax=Corticium candelabrum TaxID=121492 RepID=UPI002E2738A9|nr:ralA-binding protein 1-like isoform X2 [Corticium candelabrum]
MTTDFALIWDSDVSEDEFKDEANLTEEQFHKKQALMQMIRAGFPNDDVLEGRFGNEKLPKVSLKQRIVERSKGTGAALKSKLKRKRKEQDEKHQSHPTADAGDKADLPVFGIPISLAVERSRLCNGIELPTVFRLCLDYLEREGLSHEGLYRVSGVKSRIEAVKTQFDQGQTVDFEQTDINTITGALKLYLRELPENILTPELAPEFENAGREKNAAQLGELFSQLPSCNKLMLTWLLLHMKHITENSAVNKMSGPNLIIVFSPTLHISQNLLNFMFQNVDLLVGDAIIERYNPSEAQRASRRSLRMMNTLEIGSVAPEFVSSELKRLSSVLELLHSELQSYQLTVEERATREEEIWSVQRVLTQLKRRNRQMKGMGKALSTDDLLAETEQEESYDELWREECELRIECEELEHMEEQFRKDIDTEQAAVDQLKANIDELKSTLPQDYVLQAHSDTADIDLSGCEDEKQIINHLNDLIKDLLEERDNYVADIALEHEVSAKVRAQLRLAKCPEAS